MASDAQRGGERVSSGRALGAMPLNALRVVEALHRRGRLRGAAEELGVVPGAVRQQLQGLEDHLGISLLARAGGRVALNPAGRRLADAVAIAFGILGRAADELTGQDAAFSIRLGAPMPLATAWLMPRLPDLLAAHPRLSVDIVPVHVRQTLADRPDLDAVIAGGEYRPLPDIDAFGFVADRFGLVGTAGHAARLSEAAPGGQADVPLVLARDVPDLADDWFRESGMAPLRFARRIEVENLELAIAAARAGLGVTAAPELSVAPDIAAGRLAAPFGLVERPVGYRLCCRQADRDRKAIGLLRDWLVRQGAEKMASG